MKYTLLLSLFSAIGFAQTSNDNVLYLDSLKNRGNEHNFKYNRIVKDYDTPNQKTYIVKDFYKSGPIEMKGASTSRDYLYKTGEFIYYYENGNVKSIISYDNDKPIGLCSEYYENGNKKLEGEGVDDDKTIIPNIKIKNFWDENSIETIKNGNGYYEEKYINGYSKGKIKNNVKDSIWIGEFKKPKFTFIENYKNGKFVSGVSIDSIKKERKYNVLEINPEKSVDDFYRYIAKTYKSPNVPGLKGKVYVNFVVQTDGSIKDIKVLRDIGYGTGEEAIRAISTYEFWIPAEKRGISYSFPYGIAIDVDTNP